MTTGTKPRSYIITQPFVDYWAESRSHEWIMGDIVTEVFEDVYYAGGVTVSGSRGAMFLTNWELEKLEKIEMSGTIIYDESYFPH